MPVAASMKTSAAAYFADPLRVSIGYGELLVKDIPAAKFAHMPHPAMNHPAFCIGHLCLYPNRVLTLIGKPQLIVEKPGWPELFKAGVACVEQDGRYPSKDELVAVYLERYRTVCDAIGDVDEEVFARENPTEGRFRQMFPTVGGAVNFMLNNHHMTHLGQISAWRRAVGLPGVM